MFFKEEDKIRHRNVTGVQTCALPIYKKTFELLQRGDTIGIFQLASPGVQDLLRRMQPTTIDDIAATTALYRPGPMGMQSHTHYAERKSGREEVETPIHEEFANSPLEEILNGT